MGLHSPAIHKSVIDDELTATFGAGSSVTIFVATASDEIGNRIDLGITQITKSRHDSADTAVAYGQLDVVVAECRQFTGGQG